LVVGFDPTLAMPFALCAVALSLPAVSLSNPSMGEGESPEIEGWRPDKLLITNYQLLATM
jgi:hypothetical protein